MTDITEYAKVFGVYDVERFVILIKFSERVMMELAVKRRKSPGI